MTSPRVLLLTTMLAACAPGPELAVAPEILAARWSEAAPSAATPLADGWSAFGSPELETLIARALAANADVAIAAARVAQARGQLGVARAASLPTLSASADAFTGSDGRRLRADDTSLGIDIAYDVDLFGSARAGSRSARARLAATRFDAQAVALAVSADTARGFVQYAALQTRIALLGRALEGARELDRIIGVRVREGVATRVDSGLQTVEVRRIEAEISRLAEAQARTRNALAILVGAEAPLFTLDAPSLDGLTPPAFDAAQPATLLTRRPDIRAAESRITAARGDVDRARAAFLPSLRISAGSLLGAGSGGPLGLAFSAGSSLFAPIFAGGRLRGDLLASRGAQAESVETYRRALLTALGETEDALAGIAGSRRRADLLADTLTVARNTARLARRQYVEGAADLPRVLDAERGALDVEEGGVLARQERLVAAIDLYRALGGPPA